MIELYTPQIGNGDCFLICIHEKEQKQLLVIDSGFAGTYSLFKQKLLSLMKAYNCETHMMLTHIDRDHIGGYRKLFQDPDFQMYDHITAFYYNTLFSLQALAPDVTEEMVDGADRISMGTLTSYSEAVTLETLLKGKRVSVITGLYSGTHINLSDEIRMTFFSPSVSSMLRYREWTVKKELETEARITDFHKSLKELVNSPYSPDNSITNASSLSFLIESGKYKLLFLGDTLSEDVSDSLRSMGYSQQTPLFVDVVKVSHHGRKHNTSPELLRLIRGKYFLISGQDPDKETLARIVYLQDEPVFWFNYDLLGKLLTESEISEFNIKSEYRTEWVLK